MLALLFLFLLLLALLFLFLLLLALLLLLLLALLLLLLLLLLLALLFLFLLFLLFLFVLLFFFRDLLLLFFRRHAQTRHGQRQVMASILVLRLLVQNALVGLHRALVVTELVTRIAQVVGGIAPDVLAVHSLERPGRLLVLAGTVLDDTAAVGVGEAGERGIVIALFECLRSLLSLVGKPARKNRSGRDQHCHEHQNPGQRGRWFDASGQSWRWRRHGSG